MTKHSKEPWKILGEIPPNCGHTLDGGRFYRQIIAGQHCATIVAAEMDENNAKRIVDCVNAMAELENPGAIGEVLTAALKVCNATYRESTGSYLSNAVEALRDALAKLAFPKDGS